MFEYEWRGGLVAVAPDVEPLHAAGQVFAVNDRRVLALRSRRNDQPAGLVRTEAPPEQAYGRRGVVHYVRRLVGLVKDSHPNRDVLEPRFASRGAEGEQPSVAEVKAILVDRLLAVKPNRFLNRRTLVIERHDLRAAIPFPHSGGRHGEEERFVALRNVERRQHLKEGLA